MLHENRAFKPEPPGECGTMQVHHTADVPVISDVSGKRPCNDSYNNNPLMCLALLLVTVIMWGGSVVCMASTSQIEGTGTIEWSVAYLALAVGWLLAQGGIMLISRMPLRELWLARHSNGAWVSAVSIVSMPITSAGSSVLYTLALEEQVSVTVLTCFGMSTMAILPMAWGYFVFGDRIGLKALFGAGGICGGLSMAATGISVSVEQSNRLLFNDTGLIYPAAELDRGPTVRGWLFATLMCLTWLGGLGWMGPWGHPTNRWRRGINMVIPTFSERGLPLPTTRRFFWLLGSMIAVVTGLGMLAGRSERATDSGTISAWLLVASSLLGGLAILPYTKALEAPGAVGAMVAPLSMIYNVIPIAFAVLVLGDSMTVIGIVGVLLCIGATIVIGFEFKDSLRINIQPREAYMRHPIERTGGGRSDLVRAAYV